MTQNFKEKINNDNNANFYNFMWFNSSFIWSRSEQYVESWEESLPVEERLSQLFRRFFSRDAVPSELKMGTSYVALSGKEPWIRYVHALLISNEFGFVD